MSGIKATCHSAVQIAAVLLVFGQIIEANTVFGIEPFFKPSTPTTKAAEIAAANNAFEFNQFHEKSTTTTTTTTTQAPKVGSSFGFGLFNIPSAITNKAAEAVNSLGFSSGFGLFKSQTTTTTTTTTKAPNSFVFGQFNTQSTTTTKAASTAFPTKVATTTTTTAFTTKEPTTAKATFQTLTTKSAGTGDYCSMCKSHVACKKNNVRSHIVFFSLDFLCILAA